MAISNVTTWELFSTDIIAAALRKIAYLVQGISVNTNDTTSAMQALNAMIKTFQTTGMPLWKMQETNFPLTATNLYTIGNGQTINTDAPLKVVQARRVYTDSGVTVPMNIYTHYDFRLLTSQQTVGTPINIWYEPLRTTGNIHIWPIPDATTIAQQTITIQYQAPFDDMVNPGDSIDFPSYWTEAVIYGLAVRLAPEYGVPLPDRAVLKQEANTYLEMALSYGLEEGSIHFQPDWSYWQH